MKSKFITVSDVDFKFSINRDLIIWIRLDEKPTYSHKIKMHIKFLGEHEEIILNFSSYKEAELMCSLLMKGSPRGK